MKKIIIITICLLMTVLYSCKAEEAENMEVTNSATITVINDVKEADFWILPQTQENQKTTLWGTATAAKVQTGESRQAFLSEPGDGGLYLLRMIDADGFFYSADGIILRSGWVIRIKGNDRHEVTAEVTDENGALDNTYDVFSARL